MKFVIIIDTYWMEDSNEERLIASSPLDISNLPQNRSYLMQIKIFFNLIFIFLNFKHHYQSKYLKNSSMCTI